MNAGALTAQPAVPHPAVVAAVRENARAVPSVALALSSTDKDGKDTALTLHTA